MTLAQRRSGLSPRQNKLRKNRACRLACELGLTRHQPTLHGRKRCRSVQDRAARIRCFHLNQKEGVSILLAEQNTNVALKYADYGYILESGRIMMDGPAKALAENKDVKEFYLGISSEGRKSFRDMKSYRHRKRWV